MIRTLALIHYASPKFLIPLVVLNRSYYKCKNYYLQFKYYLTLSADSAHIKAAIHPTTVHPKRIFKATIPAPLLRFHDTIDGIMYISTMANNNIVVLMIMVLIMNFIMALPANRL